MGWKLFAVVVENAQYANDLTVLNALGYTSLNKSADLPFEEASYPDEHKLYIGRYKNHLIICSAELPLHFLGRTQSPTEARLRRLFPGSDIAAFVLHSAINLWGYAVWEQGKKIRVRAGSAESDEIVEAGDPLLEEYKLVSRAFVNEKGQRMYYGAREMDEPLTEHQMGEEFVFRVWARYFGVSPENDPELMRFEMEGYAVEEFTRADMKAARKEAKSHREKKWWQFWKRK